MTTGANKPTPAARPGSGAAGQRTEGRLKTTAKGSDHRPAATEPEPVTFRWVIHPVTGDQARMARAAQAKAIKELLRWLDTQR